MVNIDELRRQTDELNPEEVPVNEEMGDDRGSAAVAEAPRSESEQESAERAGSESEGSSDVVRTGLLQEVRNDGGPVAGEGDGVSDASAKPAPEPEVGKSARSITMVNGAKFHLGEILPWKGIHFQVIHLHNSSIVLQGVGLTEREIKRMLKARSNA